MVASYFEITLVAIWQYKSSHRLDRIQSDFMEEFSQQMSDASQKLEPMELKDRKDVLPVHIVAIIATLGTYAPLFALWSMHGFNTHMRGQWSYEAKILGWMAEKEGAVKLERVHEKESNAIEHLRRVV